MDDKKGILVRLQRRKSESAGDDVIRNIINIVAEVLNGESQRAGAGLKPGMPELSWATIHHLADDEEAVVANPVGDDRLFEFVVIFCGCLIGEFANSRPISALENEVGLIRRQRFNIVQDNPRGAGSPSR